MQDFSQYFFIATFHIATLTEMKEEKNEYFLNHYHYSFET